MARPRHHLLPEHTPLHVHCVQRCVRRAFLCGDDALTGRSFEHRRAWLEQRIHLLAECFAVAVHAYAVMSNHLHLVLSISPATVNEWSDEDVARRWCRLFPPADDTPTAIEHKVAALCSEPERLMVLRQRLGSLSWCMKCLAEPIARRANAEDGCTGRFWEGRFKAQRLLDDNAVLAAMAYVDLNPVRAGMATTLADSAHTSIRLRLQRDDMLEAKTPLRPALGLPLACPPLALGQYIALVEWSGRQLRPGKRGALGKDNAPQGLPSGNNPQGWLRQVKGIESRYWRAIGAVEQLAELAARLGQCWLKGVGFAGRLVTQA